MPPPRWWEALESRAPDVVAAWVSSVPPLMAMDPDTVRTVSLPSAWSMVASPATVVSSWVP